MKRLVIIGLLAARITAAQEPQFVIAPNYSSASRGYVGLWVSGGPDFRVITYVDQNSPAAKAGVSAGDYITAIDQYSTAEMSVEEFCRHAFGSTGTFIQLMLKRAETGATELVQLERVRPAGPGFYVCPPGSEEDFRMISAVERNGGAAKAGIIAGDYVLAVDQYSTAEMSPEKFCSILWGAADSYMQLTLRRAQTGATEVLQVQRISPQKANPKPDDMVSDGPAVAQK